MAVEGADERRGFDYMGLPEQIERASRLLKGTQKGDMLAELHEAMGETSNAMFGIPGAKEVSSSGYREAKERIMDITNKMNRGGLASRR